MPKADLNKKVPGVIIPSNRVNTIPPFKNEQHTEANKKSAYSQQQPFFAVAASSTCTRVVQWRQQTLKCSLWNSCHVSVMTLSLS